jgi:hypothetical protein
MAFGSSPGTRQLDAGRDPGSKNQQLPVISRHLRARLGES